AEAYLMYSQAAAMSPNTKTYWQRAQAVQTRAALEARALPPAMPPELSTEPAPALPAEVEAPPLPEATFADKADARKMLPPTELRAQPGQQDFDITGDTRGLFEKVAKSFGLDCVFDENLEPGKSFRLQLADVDYRDALHAMEAATGTFLVPVSDKI